MKAIITIFIIIVLLLIAKVLIVIKESFDMPEYLKHKSSCFSCEKQFIDMYGIDSAWRGNPTKMFSAEQQGVDMYGEEGGFIGKSMKYY